MIQVFERGRWSITFGGEADPVWMLRLQRFRLEGTPTPTGPAYESLMDLVRGELPNADPILFNLLEIAEQFAHSPEYFWLTQPAMEADANVVLFVSPEPSEDETQLPLRLAA